MSTVQPESELREQFARIEALLGTVQEHGNPAVLAAVQEIVQSLLSFHAAGVSRLIEGFDSGVLVRLADDELVSGLLVLHGLHPLDLQTRVQQALDSVRGKLAKHDAQVDLIDIVQDGVRLRLHLAGHGCGSTMQALRDSIEQAVHAFAPDVTGLAIEAEEPASRPAETFIPVEQLLPIRSKHLEEVPCLD